MSIYKPIGFNNEYSEFPNRRRLIPVENEENTFDVERAVGEIHQNGDINSAEKFNKLEENIGSTFDNLQITDLKASPGQAGKIPRVTPAGAIELVSIDAPAGDGIFTAQFSIFPFVNVVPVIAELTEIEAVPDETVTIGE